MTQCDTNSPEAPGAPGYGMPPPVGGRAQGAPGSGRRSVLGKIALGLAIVPWLTVAMLLLLQPG
jgi:hypothetical protein